MDDISIKDSAIRTQVLRGATAAVSGEVKAAKLTALQAARLQQQKQKRC